MSKEKHNEKTQQRYTTDPSTECVHNWNDATITGFDIYNNKTTVKCGKCGTYGTKIIASGENVFFERDPYDQRKIQRVVDNQKREGS